MRHATAFDHRTRARTRLIDVHSSARIGRVTSDQLNEMVAVVYASIAKCPTWVRAYLDGTRDALCDTLYRDHLEYCSLLSDGRVVSHRSASPRYYQKLGFTPEQIATGDRTGLVVHAGHYWRDSDRLFFTSEHPR